MCSVLTTPKSEPLSWADDDGTTIIYRVVRNIPENYHHLNDDIILCISHIYAIWYVPCAFASNPTTVATLCVTRACNLFIFVRSTRARARAQQVTTSQRWGWDDVQINKPWHSAKHFVVSHVLRCYLPGCPCGLCNRILSSSIMIILLHLL